MSKGPDITQAPARLWWGDGEKILRKFLVGKNEKEQQFLAFIKASFQGYWPIFIPAPVVTSPQVAQVQVRRTAKKYLTALFFSGIVYLEAQIKQWWGKPHPTAS